MTFSFPTIDINGVVHSLGQVSGTFLVDGPISSSAGSFGELSVYNNGNGQSLSSNVWKQITQFMTSSMTSPGVVAANNGLTASVPGMYVHYCTLSFSGAAGTYTFAMFENGVQGVDSTIQTTINVGQSYPRNVTVMDMDFHHVSELPAAHDMRVKSNNGGTFVINYGNFGMYRVVG